MTASLKSPGVDGAVLLHPEGEALAGLIETACARHAQMPFEVAGMPAEELRRQCRAEVAGLSGLDPQGFWVVAAHQAELVHAGVWFKDAAAVALAQVLEAGVLHVVADLDVLKHDALTLPNLDVGAEHASAETFRFVSHAGLQCPAQLAPPPAEMLEQALTWAKARIRWDCLFDRWATAARGAIAANGSLAQWFTAAQQAVGDELGVSLPRVFVSRLCRGKAFARFVADMALRHRQLHQAHAEALAEYRAAAHETNPAQPVPDLKRKDEAWELPLWAYRGRAPREPVYVAPTAGALRLQTPAGTLLELPTNPEAAVESLLELARQNIVLAPRALPLTLFVRTFLADLFIHGTGGSRYDEVTDALSRRWWGWTPPPYITATATARLPLEPLPVKREDLGEARWHAHHAWHNPRLYAEAQELSPAVETLLRRKAHILKDLRQLPRFSEVRAAAFDELQQVNAELRTLMPAALERTSRQVEHIRRQLAYNSVVMGREYFFALLGADKLARLADQARQWASAAGVRAGTAPCAAGCGKARGRAEGE